MHYSKRRAHKSTISTSDQRDLCVGDHFLPFGNVGVHIGREIGWGIAFRLDAGLQQLCLDVGRVHDRRDFALQQVDRRRCSQCRTGAPVARKASARSAVRRRNSNEKDSPPRRAHAEFMGCQFKFSCANDEGVVKAWIDDDARRPPSAFPPARTRQLWFPPPAQ